MPTTSTILALGIATFIPLIILYLIYTRDLYGTGAFRYIVLCFLWGWVAFAVAAFVNGWLIGDEIIDRLVVLRFIAPFEEEILKGLILIYLIRRPQFTYFVDGAIYGFAAGIGFAVIENFDYILGATSGHLDVAIGRVISTNLIHGAASAFVGIAFGLARFSRGSGRAVRVLAGLILAIAVHTGFNNLVTRVNSGLLLVYATVVGVTGVGVIWASIQRGLAEEKAWIEEKLGMADRVTASEAAVVHRIADVDEILKPLAMRFGEEKASQIEKFLFMQARLGILRKTLEKLQDENLLEATRQEMAQIQQEMDEYRRSVGAIPMMYLRSIFPEDDSPLWGSLEGVIERHIANQPASGGSGLWEKLGATAKPSSDSGENKKE
jgi:RsiW-degrading membrane proteinase PrsW (M82 family)